MAPKYHNSLQSCVKSNLHIAILTELRHEIDAGL
jgi:hypothetical protein